MKYLRDLFYFLICTSILLISIKSLSIYYQHKHERLAYTDPISKQCLIPQIRLVRTTLPEITHAEPIPKRDISVLYYLQCSVRISISNVSGSGTICYYDPQTNEAYVISCGHLFMGTENPGQSAPKSAKIHVFYKNNIKLSTPQTFVAQLICHSAEEDISILKFKPDWPIEHYFAIAPLEYPISQNEALESVGCDHAEETASYTVRVTEGMKSGRNLITQENSPRPGRSGGGLLTKDGYFVGIVWGTSQIDGTGYGYNVPLRRIYDYLKQFKETEWLLHVERGGNLYLIPIINRDGTIFKVPNGYIPSPRSNYPRP